MPEAVGVDFGDGDRWWTHDAPVCLGRTICGGDDVVEQVLAALPGGRETSALLDWAQEVGPLIPQPGSGQTRVRWEVLASVAARDLVAARVLEPHLDALAILEEAGGELDPEVEPLDGTWGVWAAEGPGGRLRATRQGGEWVLDGVKPWCSLAGQVTRGLVTAWVDDERRGLFVVDTRRPGFEADSSGWSPSGLREVGTAVATMRSVSARHVGGPGWYLQRAGFAWGGAGVAAVWYGGAVAVARRLMAEAARRAPDDLALWHLGSVHARLTVARLVLAAAADEIDAGRAAGMVGDLIATEARNVVAEAAEDVLARAAHGLGPGPLSQEPEHARRVDDLALYLRQHHAERDVVALGRSVLSTASGAGSGAGTGSGTT